MQNSTQKIDVTITLISSLSVYIDQIIDFILTFWPKKIFSHKFWNNFFNQEIFFLDIYIIKFFLITNMSYSFFFFLNLNLTSLILISYSLHLLSLFVLFNHYKFFFLFSSTSSFSICFNHYKFSCLFCLII